MNLLFFSFLLLVPGELAPVNQTATPYLLGNDRDDGPIFPLSAVSQIVLNGNRLYIRSARDAQIAVLSLEGKVLDVIGRDGEGPGEFTYGVWSMGVDGRNLWALGHTRRTKLQYFLDHQYQTVVSVGKGGNPGISMSANGLAVHDGQVVVPVWPKTGFIAAAYQRDGSRKLFGELLFTGEDADVVSQVPGVNDTMWRFHDGFYYCLFKYQPIVRKYDTSFRLVKNYVWTTAVLEEKMHKIFNPEGESHKKPEILFTDFKVWGDKIYVMGQGWLHRVNQATGELDQVLSFTIERGEKKWRHHFHCFELLSPTQVILGHFFGDPVWLWKATIPK